MSALTLSYFAGLLTTLNPCVLPMLPIVMAGTMAGSRFGPIAFAAGMVFSFTAAGLFVASIGIGLGITQQVLRNVASVMLIGFGLVLLIRPLQKQLAFATVGLASGADALAYRVSASGGRRGPLMAPFVIGLLAGAMWSPCSGPSLGAAFTLAAESGGLLPAAFRMLFFGLGATTTLVVLAYGTRAGRNTLMAIADWIRPAAAIVFVAVGLLILLGFDKTLESAALDLMPGWLSEFTTRF